MRNFILGTDWWTDCDDVVAMRIMCRAIKQNKACLKGVVINACMEYSVSSLDGFLNCEGITGIPLGIDKEATDFGGNPPYQKGLSEYAERYKTNDCAEDAVRLYRTILAQATEKIELIEIGYLQAVAALIESGADDISEMDGLQLLREKVSKVWVMAGKWDDKPGKENNFIRNERSRIAASVFCEKMPVPVTFLGYEVGYDVISGGYLKEDDILYKVLCDHGSCTGRSSWDPMLMQLALIGDEFIAGYDIVTGMARVDQNTGENYFKDSAFGNHNYVIKRFNNDYYKNEINALIK